MTYVIIFLPIIGATWWIYLMAGVIKEINEEAKRPRGNGFENPTWW